MIGRLFEADAAPPLRAYVVPFVLLLVPAIGLLLQPDVAAELHRQWTTSGEIDYGYLLLAALALYFVREVTAMQESSPAPIWLGPGLLVAVGIALAGEIQLQAAVLIGIAALWGCTSLAVLGWPARNLMLICCALLILATPVPFLLVPYLRELTVLCVTSLTKLVGITAFIENNLIHLPTGTIEIADGCAGEKYLRSSLIMAFASLALRLNRYHALVTLGLFALAALLANWVRVFVLVVIAHRTSTENSLVLEHDWLGWLIFAGVLLALFWLVLEPQRTAATDAGEPKGTTDVPDSPQSGPRFRQTATLAAALALSLVPLVTAFAFSGVPNRVTAFQSLAGLDRCDSVPPRGSSPVNRIAGADLELEEVLRCRHGKEVRTVHRYSAAFQAASRGKDLTAWLSAPLSPERWNVLTGGTTTVLPTHKAGVVMGDLRGTGQRWAVVYWYATDTHGTPSPLEFKVRSLLKQLSGRYAESATRLYMRCQTDCDETAAQLIDLVKAALQRPDR